MASIFTHPGKLGWFKEPVKGSFEINLPSDPSNWQKVTDIVNQVASSSPKPDPTDLTIYGMAKRYADNRRKT